MTEQELRELRERIVESLRENGIELPLGSKVPDDIITAIEWDAVIVSSEEWRDVRIMRERIGELNDIVVEWSR